MKGNILWVSLACIGFSSAVEAQVYVDLSEDSTALHPISGAKRVLIELAFEDYSYMLSDLCEAVEIVCRIYTMMGKIGTAIAYVDSYGDPIIVYDRRLSPEIGYIGAKAVIAHELGHHYCGHFTTKEPIPQKMAEMEADRFMGFAMAKSGTALSDLIETYETLGIDAGSSTHPPMSIRALEITKGYFATDLREICAGHDPK